MAIIIIKDIDIVGKITFHILGLEWTPEVTSLDALSLWTKKKFKKMRPSKIWMYAQVTELDLTSWVLHSKFTALFLG